MIYTQLPPRPRWRGFSFALYPTRCRVFILPGCNTATNKPLQHVLPCPCNYTANATKQRTGLYSGFSCDCSRSTVYYTRPTKAAIIPPVPRWRAYTRPDALNRYQIPPPRRTLYRPAQAAYYNKVYKRGQHIADHASPAAGHRLHLYRVSPAGSRCFPRPAACSLAPGSGSGRGGRRGTIGGFRRISFRAVAR